MIVVTDIELIPGVQNWLEILTYLVAPANEVMVPLKQLETIILAE